VALKEADTLSGPELEGRIRVRRRRERGVGQ